MADNLIDKGLDEIAKIRGISGRRGRGARRGGGGRGGNSAGASGGGRGARFSRGFGRRPNPSGSIQKRRSGGGANNISPHKAAAAVCYVFSRNN